MIATLKNHLSESASIMADILQDLNSREIIIPETLQQRIDAFVKEVPQDMETISKLAAMQFDDMYKLIEWPASQEYMDEPWFETEAELALDRDSSSYFIPVNRLK